MADQTDNVRDKFTPEEQDHLSYLGLASNMLKALATVAFLFAGSAFADTVVIDNIYQDGPYTYVDVSRIGPSPASPNCVPNLTPEQAAAYLNSTAEGRAASAKFDEDLKKSSAQLAAEIAAGPAPRAELVQLPPCSH